MRTVIGHHLILTGYAHWLPNDVRGSGSDEVRGEELRPLGQIYYGRKEVQPPREELRVSCASGREIVSQGFLVR